MRPQQAELQLVWLCYCLPYTPLGCGAKAAWKGAAPAKLLTYACNQCSECFAIFFKMAKQMILCFRKEVNGELHYRYLMSCSYGEIRTQLKKEA